MIQATTSISTVRPSRRQRGQTSGSTSKNALALAANLYERALAASLLGNGGAAKELGRRCMAASRETADLVMHGCAYRLLGDLVRDEDPYEARRLYSRALAAFAEAGDQTACDEIEVRLQALP